MEVYALDGTKLGNLKQSNSTHIVVNLDLNKEVKIANNAIVSFEQSEVYVNGALAKSFRYYISACLVEDEIVLLNKIDNYRPVIKMKIEDVFCYNPIQNIDRFDSTDKKPVLG